MDKIIRIEVLFPEIANLYGDLENISYLKKSCPEIEVVETHLVGEPCFVEKTPDLIYMGTLTERGQRLAVEKLAQYKAKIVEMIDEGVHFLVTGNALEVFGGKITDTNGTEDCGLGIFPTYAKRNMMNRFNSLYLAKFVAEESEMDIVGYKSQFTHSYWDGENEGYVFDTIRGPGLNPGIMGEGVRRNNFFGTYVIGPVLVLNPPFAKWLLKEIGAGDVNLAFEKEAMEAYEARVAEYSNPDTGFYY
ncbi:MAG: hypothetical protein IKW01_04140 [Firmicutes bacterium]|nr:hypothetical protein [Bacillota bacterium]